MRRKERLIIGLMGLMLPILFCVDMCVGGVGIGFVDVVKSLAGGDVAPEIDMIVRDIRLIKAIVAVCVGVALSVSGLEMQTMFRNPLAGPYVLGISSGASLGVAIFILGSTLFAVPGGLMQIGIAGSAWLGSGLVLLLIIMIGSRVRDIMVILILGMMFSSGVSAIVQIFQFLSKDDALKSYVIWTMGSLGEVTHYQLWIMVPVVVVGLLLAVASVKPLNLLLMGEEYAETMGLNVKRSRGVLFASTSLLAGTVTAFCGPIGFIGVALPHVARMMIGNADNKILLPTCILVGAIVMLLCDMVSKMYLLPINAITALIGIPIIIGIVLTKR